MELRVIHESWPIHGTFTISRGSKTQADVVVVEVCDQGITGRGECLPYPRYGESIASVMAQIESVMPQCRTGLNHTQLAALLPAGAARNALDCALWDWQCKVQRKRIWTLMGDPAPHSLVTAYTLSLDTPENMFKAASEHASRPLLKLKLAGEGDVERVQAVRRGAPKARIIVDANEGWTPELYQRIVPALVEIGVEMIEQPFPAGQDEVLATLPRPIPICADESCHDSSTLASLVGRYDMINIKLDKTGGLTEALQLKQAALNAGLDVMVGCMLATSLSMAPAFIVAQGAKVVDLDGPLLLARDRESGIEYTDTEMLAPQAALWG